MIKQPSQQVSRSVMIRRQDNPVKTAKANPLPSRQFEPIVIQEMLEFVLKCKNDGRRRCKRWESVCPTVPTAEPFLLLRQAASPLCLLK
jgi:hypothetical protein